MTGGFLVQRYFPTLKIGVVPTALRNGRAVRIHVAQGDWDSACGAHCAAMALSLLGEIGDAPAICERRNGVAARLFREARVTYFDGATVDQMASMISALRTGRAVKRFTGHHRACVDFIRQEITKNNVVIVSWRSKRGNQHHWVLIVGIEGVQTGKTFVPHAFLAMDPGVAEPVLAGCNGRIEFAQSVAQSRSYVRYLTADGTTLLVRITSALSIAGHAKSPR